MVTDTIEAGLQTEREGVREKEKERERVSSETARQSDRMDE